jgi:hypothetical protein
MRDVSNEGDREAMQEEAMTRNRVEGKYFSQTATKVIDWVFTE